MPDHPELTPEEARQAKKAPMVRRVLIVSLAAAAVLLAALAYVLTQQPRH